MELKVVWCGSWEMKLQRTIWLQVYSRKFRMNFWHSSCLTFRGEIFRATIFTSLNFPEIVLQKWCNLGTIAGAVQCVITGPMELIKTRMQVTGIGEKTVKPSLLSTTREIYKSDGIREWWPDFLVFSLIIMLLHRKNRHIKKLEDLAEV